MSGLIDEMATFIEHCPDSRYAAEECFHLVVAALREPRDTPAAQAALAEAADRFRKMAGDDPPGMTKDTPEYREGWMEECASMIVGGYLTTFLAASGLAPPGPAPSPPGPPAADGEGAP